MQYFQQRLRQAVTAFLLQLFRYSIETLSDGACDAGQSVAVAAQGYSSADHILEGFPLQKCGGGFRDSFLAGFYMVVCGADLVAGTAEIIAKSIFHVCLDLGLGAAGAAR